MAKVIIDSREDKKIVRLADRLNFDYEVDSLPVGDIVCEEKNIVIERKTLPDFVQSIRSGHLQKQLLQMDEFDYPILLLSGKYSDLHWNKSVRGWRVAHYVGSLASLAVRYDNIRVLQVDNDTQLMKCAKRIIDKVDDGNEIDIYATELLKHDMNSEHLKIKLLTAVRGIGIKRAKKFLENEKIANKVNEFISFLDKNGVMKYT